MSKVAKNISLGVGLVIFCGIFFLHAGFLAAQDSALKDSSKKEEVVDENEIIDEGEDAKRDKTIATIIESFEFGTPDEIRNSLAIFRRLKNPADIEKILPPLGKLIDAGNFEIIKAAAFSLHEKKIFSLNDKLYKHLKAENTLILNDILNLFSAAKDKNAEQPLMQLFSSKDLSVNENQTQQLINALTKIESSVFAAYTLATIKDEFAEVFQGSQNKNQNESPNESIEKIHEMVEQEKKTGQFASQWARKDKQKLDPTILENLILALSELKYHAAAGDLHKILRSAFKEYDPQREEFKDLPDVKISVTAQGYLVHALGNLEHGSQQSQVVETMKLKLHKYESYHDDDKRKFFNLQMQLITALSKLNDDTGEKILVQSLKDNNPVVRQRAAKLLTHLRSEEAMKLLSYRALRDANSKVAFECLGALLETLEPGSTTQGKIIGKTPTAKAQAEALEGIIMYLNPQKNPLAHLHWLKYMAENVKHPTVTEKIVFYIQEKIPTFYAKERQTHAVSVLTAIAEKSLRDNKAAHPQAMALLQKLSTNKDLRHGAIQANRSLRFLSNITP